MQAQSLSHVWLFATLWTVAHQAPLSMRFFKQEHWSGVLFPPPGDLPAPWWNSCLLHWLMDSLPPSHWEALKVWSAALKSLRTGGRGLSLWPKIFFWSLYLTLLFFFLICVSGVTCIHCFNGSLILWLISGFIHKRHWKNSESWGRWSKGIIPQDLPFRVIAGWLHTSTESSLMCRSSRSSRSWFWSSLPSLFLGVVVLKAPFCWQPWGFIPSFLPVSLNPAHTFVHTLYQTQLRLTFCWNFDGYTHQR